jgi:glycosyltransferase involved in cell wall biosynthesis
MRIKVVHVIWDLAATGGAEKLMIHFAKNLDSQTFDVSFVSLLHKGDIGHRLEGLGFPVYALELPLSKAWNPVMVLKLYGLFRKLNPQVVHVHLNYAGIVAARMARTPLIVNHIHNIYPGKSRLRIFMDRAIFGLADVSIAVSQNAKESTLQQLGTSKLPIEVVRNGIDVSTLTVIRTEEQIRRELSIPDDQKIILTVGSLTDQKGQAHLVAAFARATCALRKARLLIVGTGPLEDSLKKQVADLGMEGNILLTGLRNDIPSLLNAASVFVFPSLWEGIPLALLEAMYSRLPCIATRVGGVGEIIEDGKDGILIDPGDEEDRKSVV